MRYSTQLNLIKIITILAVLICVGATYADHSSSSSGLHFSHPLITESPSPDSKIRLDYFYFDIDDGEEKAVEQTANLEIEHALHSSFSFEVVIPYTFLDLEYGSSENHLGNIEVGLKFANFTFVEHNLLLGYGIDLGLPTGDDGDGIGSDHILEIEPFYQWAINSNSLSSSPLYSSEYPQISRMDKK